MSGRRIGLLGGSFNPAHAGHLHISQEALKRLQLDEIWWLVSPQNPLKDAGELAAYPLRLRGAVAMAATERRIRVCDLEARHHLHYTVDTLRWILRHHRGERFVWLMGADNLASFHRWRQWRRVAAMVPIAVLDRAPYAFRGLHGRFALAMKAARQAANKASRMAFLSPPCWIYLTIPRSTLSATHLRKTLGRAAYLRHNISKA
jgi:nicotinate-nucleotide adenylyltransferase